MKSNRFLRLVGILFALNLVACAHEIPLEGGDLTEQESAEEQVAEQQVWSSEGESETAEVVAASPADAPADGPAEAPAEELAEAPANDPVVTQTVDTENLPSVDASATEVPNVRVRQVATEAAAKVEVTVKAPATATQPPRNEKNRYYVARTGDTAEYVSMLIYRSTDEAAKLLAWNGPSSTWTPGKVIYYVSPDHPEDTKVVSFYEERGLPYDSMTVQPGDTLAGLAEKLLGNPLSSKEIALVNGLKEDEPLKPGQVLRVYPSPLLGKTRAEMTVAQAPPPTAMEKSDSVKGPAIITLAPASAPEKPKVSLASSVMSTLFNHHPLVVACVFAILALFGGFYYLHRRNGGSHLDF